MYVSQTIHLYVLNLYRDICEAEKENAQPSSP